MADPAVKLTKRHWNVLKALERSDEFQPLRRLPNGNGHCAGGYNASGKTLRELEDGRLVKFGTNPGPYAVGGYALTDKGRVLLDALKEEGEGRDHLGER